MLNPEQLRTFVVAAERLNFTQAAQVLHISQPTVSQHIRELESHLGVSLFERRGRGMSLTQAGERLRPMAKASLAQLERTQATMDEFRGEPQSTLRLGTTSTVGIYLLHQMLGLFSQRFPGIRVSVQIGDPATVHRWLKNGDLDMGLMSVPPPADQCVGWDCTPFEEDEIVLIASPKHALTAQPHIDVTDLAKVSLIMRHPNSPTRQLVNDGLASAGFDPELLRVRFEFNHTEGLKQAVMANLGLAFTSRYAIAAELAAGRLRELPIHNLRFLRSLWLVHRGNHQATTYENRFAELVLSHDWHESR